MSLNDLAEQERLPSLRYVGAIPVFSRLCKKQSTPCRRTINLNVGGRRFTTSLQTLTKDPDPMLAAMFSGKFEVKLSEDGAFFIDRDGIELYKITDKRGRGLLNVEAERFRCHIQSNEINHEHKSMSERLE
ncbi:BTB/POZ domain-containing protein KCTD18-like [Pocillopora verrucosa]|uniref:BTB/POZ domain-containing protein KCTD18-like n=1 Tax=Pocillopora verrucosa TaxID=203993 RepID=UPI00333E7FDD